MKKNLKQLADNRTSDYCCVECGIQYLTPEQKERNHITTFHVSECGICGETKDVCGIRNYNYLRVLKK